MSPPRTDALRELLHQAERAGIAHRLLRLASRELIAIVERLSIEPDPRRVATLERGRRIEQLLEHGMKPAVIRERLGVSEFAYRRALRAVRDLRTVESVQPEPALLTKDKIA
jgi:hypothetical protein